MRVSTLATYANDGKHTFIHIGKTAYVSMQPGSRYTHGVLKKMQKNLTRLRALSRKGVAQE